MKGGKKGLRAKKTKFRTFINICISQTKAKITSCFNCSFKREFCNVISTFFVVLYLSQKKKILLHDGTRSKNHTIPLAFLLA